MRGTPIVLALAGGLLTATTASAHAHLMASTPAQGFVGPPPAMLTLTFSERLEPKFSNLTLSKAGGAAVAAASSVGADHKTLVGKPAAPLPAGGYEVRWQAVATDGHKTAGAYSFTVK